MKAEERKELQTNSMVRFFGRMKQRLRSSPTRKAMIVWGIVLLALVVFVSWWIVARISASRNSHRWAEMPQLTTPDDLEEFIQKHRDTVQAQVARLQLARQNVKLGLEELYRNPEAAEKLLREGAETYDALARQFKSTPVLVQESLLGAGKAYEGLGELDRALERYRELQQRFEGSPLARIAAARERKIEKDQKEVLRLSEQLKKRSVATKE